MHLQSGLEALTGSANFDVAEYIWLKLIAELADQQPTIALLCKLSVARNVLAWAAKAGLPIEQATIRRIDAKKWFEAAVEACLFQVTIGDRFNAYQIPVYADLLAAAPDRWFGFEGDHLIADIQAHRKVAVLEGQSTVTWRQGIKHDAASVMELTRQPDGRLTNKSGETVEVEADYLFPLLKGTDLYHQRIDPVRKQVIVPQHGVTQKLENLVRQAPQLWAYLTAHQSAFEQRKSSIYSGKPRFSIFGIGDYSFAPYKVAVSGMHAVPVFVALGNVNGQPIMLDDTCYFIPCESALKAAFLAALLNEPLCGEFIRANIFAGAKRPVTKKLLQRIDLAALLKQSDRERVFLETHRRLAYLSPDVTHEFTWEMLESQLSVRAEFTQQA